MARSESGNVPRRDTSKPAPSAAWTTTRCHRLTRPLTSKLQALRQLLQSPSVTVPTNAPKETKRDPNESPYIPGPRKPGRRSASERALFFEDSRPFRTDRSCRTYSSASSHPQVVVQVPPLQSVYGQPFPASAIDWDAAAPGGGARAPPRPRAQPSKELDPSHPQILLSSLKPHVHPSLFHMYTGIYTALETILTSTSVSDTRELAPLRILAARRIAQCILATEEEIGSDDVWYDTAGEVGAGGEYLREIVRWHAVELVREAVVANLMPSQQKSGIGLSGVLVGLCRHLHADAEAESLLKTMMELYPLSENITNPALVTLLKFWKVPGEGVFRVLKEAVVTEGSPTALSNPSVNKVLKLAVDQVERCEAAKGFVVKALESGFGIWGNGYANAEGKRRKEAARRKGSRRSGKPGDEVIRKPRHGKPLLFRVGERAEEMALFLVEKLVVAAQCPQNTQAKAIINDLTNGFLLQDEEMRAATEDEWTEWFPIAGKVAVLLQSLGHSTEEDVAIAKEVVHCLDDVRGHLGKCGLKSLGEFVASCYGNLYTPSGKSITGEDELKDLVQRLITYASTGSFPPTSSSTPTASTKNPITPHKPNLRLVTFTPGKAFSNPQLEKERYYITQLALNVAIGFSILNCAKRDEKWNKWVRRVEHQVIGLKVRTPQKTVAAANAERKGWRWEEGIDEWVSVGGTPGGALKKKMRTRLVSKKVEIPVCKDRKRTWRNDYARFSDHLGSEGVADFDDSGSDMISPSDSDSDSIVITNPRRRHQDATLSSEDPDTSFSRIFDDDHDTPSSASDLEGEDSDYEDKPADYYIPTPARPPASVRRSPRTASRIKRSLNAFSIVMPERSSPLRFSLGGPIGSSPLPSSPPPVPGESDAEDVVGDEDEEAVLLRTRPRIGMRKREFVEISRDGREEEEEEEDELSVTGSFHELSSNIRAVRRGAGGLAGKRRSERMLRREDRFSEDAGMLVGKRKRRRRSRGSRRSGGMLRQEPGEELSEDELAL